MSYAAVASDPTNPLDTVDRSTAAAEFRTMKTYFNGMSTVASSTTPDIFNSTNHLINYTGIALATGFVAAPIAGADRTLLCAAAAQFTAGTNLLIDGVPSGTTITVAANTIMRIFAVTTTQFRMLLVSDVGTIQGYVGEVRQGFFSTPPNGWLGVPTAAGGGQVVSRTTYAALNALMSAASYPFGAGDGSTTFGIPYIPAGYTWAQVVTTLGAQTVGALLAHTHGIVGSYTSGGVTQLMYSNSNGVNPVTFASNSTGGSANLPASVGINYIIKY